MQNAFLYVIVIIFFIRSLVGLLASKEVYAKDDYIFLKTILIY